jgi:MFS family permease
LHGFTHAYCTALVPLYLMIRDDLGLRGVRAASLIVTIYGMVYCLGSYGAGVLADRFNRKILLGIGLIGNAFAITAMGLTRQYEMLILLGVLAGIFGTLFHPSANALIPAHYPKSPGMAIGLLGMGSGLGFFLGPQYAGWRAETASWQWGQIADWQRPCVELGLMGVVVGIVFLLFAREARQPKRSSPSDGTEDAMLPNRVAIEAIVTDIRGPHERTHPHLTRSLRNKTIALGMLLGWRDFAGIASISLLSIYLQKAHGYTAKHAGLVVGGMMLLSILINPLAVYFSPGKRRLRSLIAVLILAGLTIATVPMFPVVWVLPVMCIFQCFQMGSYSISDAAVLERVSPAVRGRVVGLFLMIAGTLASLSPWVMGFWSDMLKERASEPHAYLPIFGTLGAMLFVATSATPLIARMGEAAAPSAVPPIKESAGTLEAAR